MRVCKTSIKESISRVENRLLVRRYLGSLLDLLSKLVKDESLAVTDLRMKHCTVSSNSYVGLFHLQRILRASRGQAHKIVDMLVVGILENLVKISHLCKISLHKGSWLSICAED